MEHALCVHRKVLPEGHSQLARNLILLGALLTEEADRNGELTAAEKQDILGSARGYLDEALTLISRSHGENHPLTAGVMRAAAGVAEAEGRHDDASSWRARADAIRQAALEGEGVNANYLSKGAEVFAARGLYDEAFVYQQRSLDLRHSAASHEDKAEVATDEFTLGCLLQLRGRNGEAETHLEQALLLRDELFKEDHPAIQLVRESLLNLREQDG